MKFDIRAFTLDNNNQVRPQIVARKITGTQSAIQRAVIGLISLIGSDIVNPDRGIDYISIQMDFYNFPYLFSISLDRLLSYLRNKNDQHEGYSKINDITFDGVKSDINTRAVNTFLTLYSGDNNKSLINIPIQL